MSSMQEYLAAKYMSGAKADAILARADDKKPKKKRKKVAVDRYETSAMGAASAEASGSGSGGGIMLVDEDAGDGWGATHEEMMDDEAPTVETKVGEFKTAQKSNWAQVHTGDTPPPEELPDEVPADEAPQVVAEEVEPPRRGGLRTAAQLREQEERQRALEEAEAAARTNPEEEAELARLAQETVYRDSSGKKLDMRAERAAEKRRKKEADEKEAAKMEWGKGVVQRGEKEAQTRREAEEKNRDLARYANDADLNRELKGVSRWNDPAANFLTTTKSTAPQLPRYQGPWEPNRFNIPPGYRWDGVDRSTGFEKKYFQTQNSKKRRELEGYKYGTEDM